MKKQVPVSLVVAIALVIVAVVGYMVLIRPKRAETAQLAEEVAALQLKLASATRERAAEPSAAIRVADIFELSKAMPDETDMPGILLEVNAIAAASGVQFVAISPKAPVPGEAYQSVPISLTFHGNYLDLVDFLYRLRNVVRVRDGDLEAAGRLFTLDTLNLHESQAGFPVVEAVLDVSAYVYGPQAAAAPLAPAAPGATTTAPTTGDASQEAAG